MVGLTGSPEACNAAARAFRVYHHKTDETQDYLVDHSIIMYLLGAPHSRPVVRRRSAQLTHRLSRCAAVLPTLPPTDPAGEFVTFYGKNVSAPELAAGVSEHVRRWNDGKQA